MEAVNVVAADNIHQDIQRVLAGIGFTGIEPLKIPVGLDEIRALHRDMVCRQRTLRLRLPRSVGIDPGM